MSNRNNDDGIIPLVIILVGGGIAYAVWQFSTLFGLDMSTGASVMARLVGVAILAVLAWKFGGALTSSGSAMFGRSCSGWHGSLGGPRWTTGPLTPSLTFLSRTKT